MSDESDGSDRGPGDDGSARSDPDDDADDVDAPEDTPDAGNPDDAEGDDDADTPADDHSGDDHPSENFSGEDQSDGDRSGEGRSDDGHADDAEGTPNPDVEAVDHGHSDREAFDVDVDPDDYVPDEYLPGDSGNADAEGMDEEGDAEKIDDEETDEEEADDEETDEEEADDVWGTHGFDARSPDELREDAMGPDPEKMRSSDPESGSDSGADGDADEDDSSGAAPDPGATPEEGSVTDGGNEPGVGAGLVTETEGATTDYDVPDPIVPEEERQPPDDEEMPLAEHIEEMIKRLAVVVAAVAVATAVAFPFATDVINAMWYGLLPPDTPAPHLYGPLEKILSEIKVASLAGILVALPVLVYESYLFMRPGLYPKERRYYLAAVPTSLVLGTIGMAFAYFLVLPVLFDYFILYSESGVDKLAFGLQVTFDLIVALLGAFALVFQIPLLIMLAILMGVTTRRWLESRRIYFWAGFLGVGFLMGGADLTGMAPIIIAATMIGLFEGTLALLRWTQR